MTSWRLTAAEFPPDDIPGTAFSIVSVPSRSTPALNRNGRSSDLSLSCEGRRAKHRQIGPLLRLICLISILKKRRNGIATETTRTPIAHAPRPKHIDRSAIRIAQARAKRELVLAQIRRLTRWSLVGQSALLGQTHDRADAVAVQFGIRVLIADSGRVAHIDELVATEVPPQVVGRIVGVKRNQARHVVKLACRDA